MSLGLGSAGSDVDHGQYLEIVQDHLRPNLLWASNQRSVLQDDRATQACRSWSSGVTIRLDLLLLLLRRFQNLEALSELPHFAQTFNTKEN